MQLCLTFLCNSTFIAPIPPEHKHKERINSLQLDLSANPVYMPLCFFVSVITCTDSRACREAIKTASYLHGNPSLSEPAGQSTITGCGGCYKLTCLFAWVCKYISWGQGARSKKGQDSEVDSRANSTWDRTARGVIFIALSLFFSLFFWFELFQKHTVVFSRL